MLRTLEKGDVSAQERLLEFLWCWIS